MLPPGGFHAGKPMDLSSLTFPTVSRPAASRYGWAIVFSLVLVGVRIALPSAMGNALPLQFLAFAVLASAWWGGLGAGLLATAICGIAGARFFLPPGSLGLDAPTNLPRLVTFLVLGIAISSMAEALHRVARRFQAQKEALRISEERLRLAVRATQDAVWDWDIEGGTLGWSPAVAERFGWPEAPPGTDSSWWRDRVHEEDRTGVLESIRVVVSNPALTHWESEYRFRRGDGSLAYVLDRGFVQRRSDGRAVRMIGAMLDLTEQRQAQATIRDSREQLQAIIDTVPSLISFMDRAYIYRWNSRSYERWFTRPVAEITGRPISTLLGEASFAIAKPFMDRALAGEIVEYDEQMPHDKDTGRWVHVIYVPHRGFDGSVDGLVISVNDISERMQVDLSRAALAAIVENSDDAIIGKTLEGIVTSWNRAAERLFGFPAGEMIGHNVLRLFPEDRFAEEQRVLGAVRLGKSVEHYESQWRTRDGRLVDVALTTSPIQDNQGQIVGVSTIARDITERKRDMEALRLTTERFETALRTSSIVVSEQDRDLRFTWIHNSVLKRTIADITGKSDYDLMERREDADALVAIKQQVLSTGQSHRGEIDLMVARGMRSYDLSIEPRRDQSGQIIGVTAAAVDVTERVRANEQLSAARDSAEAANRSKDAFLAALSHELRTPLTPVLFLAATQERSPEVPAALRQDFAMIRRNIEIEARLIDDLLDITRITRGKLQLDLEAADAHAILARSVELVRSELDAKHLQLSLELTTAPTQVLADAVRLQQVFWNIFRNAIKFTPEKGRIVIQSRVNAEALHVTVTDSGLGITAEEMPHIFDAFAQGHEASSHRFGGLGLGLAISGLLVREHHGRIWAESAGRHQGATFHLELPLHLTTGEPVALPEPLVIAPAQPSCRILIVEDHEPTRQTLQRLLKRRGYEVAVAESTERAREIAAGSHFDLMVSDLGLPDGSGHDLAIEFGRAHGLKAIALSGYGMEEDVRRSRAAGFLDHLTKPIDIEALHNAILRALRSDKTPAISS